MTVRDLIRKILSNAAKLDEEVKVYVSFKKETIDTEYLPYTADEEYLIDEYFDIYDVDPDNILE